MKEGLDHTLDLLFPRAAITAHGLFDLIGCVFKYRQSCLRQRQQGDTPRLSNGNCRFDILLEKQLLHCTDIGAVERNKVCKSFEKDFQALRISQTGFCGDYAVIDAGVIVSIVGPDKPIASNGNTGVDSENKHARFIRSPQPGWLLR